MVISKKLQGINHQHAIQRQRHAVYQTLRFTASNSYPYCQAGLAPARRLRQNDADRQCLWYFKESFVQKTECMQSAPCFFNCSKSLMMPPWTKSFNPFKLILTIASSLISKT